MSAGQLAALVTAIAGLVTAVGTLIAHLRHVSGPAGKGGQ